MSRPDSVPPTPQADPSRSAARRDRTSLRRLWPSDGPAVRAFFLRLDAETRANRFMAAVGDRMAADYAKRVTVMSGMVVGVFVGDTLRALGELRPLGSGPSGVRRAEVALTVEQGFRRAGLGSLLLRRLAEAARNRGIAELRLRCLPHNVAMRRLITRFGAQMRLEEGEGEGTIRLAQATPFSLWQEGVEAALDFQLAVAALPLSLSLPRAA
ncbi:GCN5-like N-acetyltransferase [Methylorubrum populi]|uniref:GCN5-like N-acetyltransferase n=1 Tax=Methylorubrum populi TaxID=223967 RepID=A0A160PBH6_9HYPH|nr:GNAT family N-acetyltransferase [Methylorubrum populi]BAU89565.1 GCN5-like N-acetyltransferase [Methylorubrum populi]